MLAPSVTGEETPDIRPIFKNVVEGVYNINRIHLDLFLKIVLQIIHQTWPVLKIEEMPFIW